MEVNVKQKLYFVSIVGTYESRHSTYILHEVHQTLAVDLNHACSKMRSRFTEEFPDYSIFSVQACESSMDAMIAVFKNELNEK